MKRFIFLSSLILSIYCCDPVDKRLKVINDSEESVYIEVQRDTMDEKKWIKESIINMYFGEDAKFNIQEATYEEGDTIIMPTMGNYSKWFKSPNDYLHIYVFDTLKLYNYYLGKLKIDVCYKRYDLTKKELKQKKWTIIHGKQN